MSECKSINNINYYIDKKITVKEILDNHNDIFDLQSLRKKYLNIILIKDLSNIVLQYCNKLDSNYTFLEKYGVIIVFPLSKSELLNYCQKNPNNYLELDDNINRVFLSDNVKSFIKDKKYTICVSLRRLPEFHIVSFKKYFDSDEFYDLYNIYQDFNCKIILKDIKNYQNGDIIANKDTCGYRNEGVYIIDNNEICNLCFDNDDYGGLPSYIPLNPKDLGYSYFENEYISHNNYVPIYSSEWLINKSKIIHSLPSNRYYIVTPITRKCDGVCARIILEGYTSDIDYKNNSDIENNILYINHDKIISHLFKNNKLIYFEINENCLLYYEVYNYYDDDDINNIIGEE